MIKCYSISQSALYACTSRKKLAKLLYYEPIKNFAIDDVIFYCSFYIPKKNKKNGQLEQRKITKPKDELKQIQNRIYDLIKYIETPDYLHSGVKLRSYVTNANVHRFSNYMVTIDISNFYDNCKRNNVYNFWNNICKCAADISCILTDLVTYEGKIPTGCSTSQRIAFFSYKQMFDELNDLAQRYNCLFSVFVDDLTFSSQSSINMSRLVAEVKRILKKYGHSAKDRKIKFYGEHKTKFVTGVAITTNHELRASNKLQMQLKENLKKDIDFQSEHELRRIIGQINAIRRVWSNGSKFLTAKARVRKRLKALKA